MKTKLLFLFVLLLLLTTAVSAQVPQIVSGQVKIEGYPAPKGLLLAITSTEHNINLETSIDDNGYFLFDLSNHGIDKGNLRLVIDICRARPECTKTITLKPRLPVQVNFDVLSSQVTDTGETIVDTLYTFVCWDGTHAVDASQCPPMYVCWNDEKVHSLNECPDEPIDPYKIALGILAGLIVIASAVLAKFKWGKGFVGLSNYWKKKGDEAVKREDYHQAKKHYMRAAKMLGTAMQRAKDGLYDKANNV